MKFKYCLALAAVVFGAGCGKEERAEAVRLSKALTQKQPDFASANAAEKDLVDNARVFCGAITANGAGRGQELAQNASVVTQLANSAVEISGHLSQVRQAVYDLSLKQEYPQSIRATLITEFTKRQRFLQDVRSMLEQSSTDFLAYQKLRDFKGDTFPDGIGKLNAVLESYKPPADAVGTALAALKTKYNLTGAE